MENGEELFYLKDSGATVCSLRVKKLLISNNISNVSFEDLDKECSLYKSKMSHDRSITSSPSVTVDSFQKRFFAVQITVSINHFFVSSVKYYYLHG